jgi:hypothetical protein
MNNVLLQFWKFEELPVNLQEKLYLFNIYIYIYERWMYVITVPKIWTTYKQLVAISVFVETYYARNEYLLWQLRKFQQWVSNFQ